MIKHVVCFKLNDGENPYQAKKVLLGMAGNVPMIKGIEVGVDKLHSQRSYDVILSVLLDDMKALSDYQEDPYHVGVVKEYMHRVVKSSVAIDFDV